MRLTTTGTGEPTAAQPAGIHQKACTMSAEMWRTSLRIPSRSARTSCRNAHAPDTDRVLRAMSPVYARSSRLGAA